MSEQKCVLSQCCCGCTLRTGSWVTAILCLVLAIINTIGALYDIFHSQHQGSWFTVIVCIITLIIAILLMHGVRKENARFIRIWVYTQLVLLVLMLVGIIITAVGGLQIGTLIVGLITIAIILYFVLVVRSYAIQLESGGGANTV